MRISSVKNSFIRERNLFSLFNHLEIFFILVINFSFLACDKKPETLKSAEKVPLDFINQKQTDFPKGLWFTSLNYETGGYLGRIDLTTGEIQRTLLRIGPDTIVLPDSPDGIFLLSRSGQDAIARIKGANAQIEFSKVLPFKSNPQKAIRDPHGNVWITFLELNLVHIYSPALQELLATVDLSALGIKGHDGILHADLGSITIYDEDTILVAAQRLHRERFWTPDKLSGLAFINISKREILSYQLINVSNPILVDKKTSIDRALVVGGGDLSEASNSLAGSYLFFNKTDIDSVPVTYVNGKILAADFNNGDSAPTIIVWNPNENKSCVQLGDKKLICEGNSENKGYVFTSIKKFGNIIFVSYKDLKTSELWIIADLTNQVPKVQKIPMNLPISSLSFGP